MGFYETKYGKVFLNIKNEVTDKLKKYFILNKELIKRTRHEHVFFLDQSDRNIRQWNFPIVIDENVYIDLRQYTKENGEPRNIRTYMNAVKRGILEYEWVFNNHKFEQIASAVAIVFSTWITKTLSRRYKMSPMDEAQLELGFMVYYVSLFYKEKLESQDIDLILRTVHRRTSVNSETASQILYPEGDHYANILRNLSMESRLEHILKHINENLSVPIEGLTPGLLTNIVIIGGWIGDMSSELTAASIYHPPIFISLIEQAVESRDFERTAIGRALKDNGRNKNIRDLPAWLKINLLQH